MEQLASLRSCLEPPAATGKRDSHMWHHRPAQICTDGHAMDAVKEVAQSSLSSQSTATTALGWSTGLHEYFVRCGSAPTTEPPSPVSSKSDDSDRAEELGELGEPFGVLQFGARLSCKERAMELQQSLLQAFTSPGFQNKLHVISRRYQACQGNDPGCWSDFKKLVRSYQAEIIPQYGFEASGRGVHDMLQAFKAFDSDPDIYVNAAAINEALFSTIQVDGSGKDSHACIGFGRKPATKVAIMDMLQSLIIAFSGPSFQEEIRKLKARADCNARCEEDPRGYYHLPGRADLALPKQRQTLKSYGFRPTKQGVRDMVHACVPYLSDSEVAKTFDAVNMHLGSMNPSLL